MSGCRETGATVVVEEDRAGRLRLRFVRRSRGDVVLLAGKGHEKVQIFCAMVRCAFDDVTVASDTNKIASALRGVAR